MLGFYLFFRGVVVASTKLMFLIPPQLAKNCVDILMRHKINFSCISVSFEVENT